jgi:hypothetical protein
MKWRGSLRLCIQNDQGQAMNEHIEKAARDQTHGRKPNDLAHANVSPLEPYGPLKSRH